MTVPELPLTPRSTLAEFVVTRAGIAAGAKINIAGIAVAVTVAGVTADTKINVAGVSIATGVPVDTKVDS